MGTLDLVKLIPSAWRLKGEIEQKGWFRSKTVWFNGLVLLAGVLAACGIVIEARPEDLQELAGGLAAALPAGIAIFQAVANIWLRKKTSVPLGKKTVVKQPEADPAGEVAGGGGVEPHPAWEFPDHGQS